MSDKESERPIPIPKSDVPPSHGTEPVQKGGTPGDIQKAVINYPDKK